LPTRTSKAEIFMPYTRVLVKTTRILDRGDGIAKAAEAARPGKGPLESRTGKKKRYCVQ
jgi:hypothetical protein